MAARELKVEAERRAERKAEREAKRKWTEARLADARGRNQRGNDL